MSFIFYCPYCLQKIECEDSDEGANALCPGCGKNIIVRKGPDQRPDDSDEKKKEKQEPNSCEVYKTPVYKEPILCKIFTWNGAINIILAIISLFVAIIQFCENSSVIGWASVIGIGAFIGLAVICFGIAEFFRYVGRISDNSDAIREFVEKIYYKK